MKYLNLKWMLFAIALPVLSAQADYICEGEPNTLAKKIAEEYVQMELAGSRVFGPDSPCARAFTPIYIRKSFSPAYDRTSQKINKLKSDRRVTVTLSRDPDDKQIYDIKIHVRQSGVEDLHDSMQFWMREGEVAKRGGCATLVKSFSSIYVNAGCFPKK